MQIKVEKVIFYNPNNHYCVLKCEHNHQLIDLVGYFANPAAGIELKAAGEWIDNSQYGKQFKATALEVCLPKTKQGLIDYLSCGRIKGIGPQLATTMVDHFGDDVINVIEQTPEKLKTLPGLGDKKLKQLLDSWQGDKDFKETAIFLQSMGITANKVDKICQILGHQTLNTLKENPYILAYKVPGFGFKTCDQIALKLGFDPNAIERIHAFMVHFLEQSAQDGHCWRYVRELVEQTQANLGIATDRIEAVIADELHYLLVRFNIKEEPVIALKRIHDIETQCAQWMYNRFKTLASTVDIPVKIDGFQPTDEQIACVKKALSLQTAIITGGPGVGKTTLVKTIIQSMLYRGYKVSLCAPTGRAAKRLQESTQHEAKTIHRLLDYDPITGKFKKDLGQPLVTDCLIVDEASMIDIRLFHGLIQAIPMHTKLIIVGDIDQLPSIGPGAVLKDLINTFPMIVIRLTQIFRQSSDSLIITNAHRVNENKRPIQRNDADFFVIENEDPIKLQALLMKVVCERIPKKFNLDPIRDVQVLTPMKKGHLGSQIINQHLAQALNPNPVAQIVFQQHRFAVGDKIIVQRNNYEKEIFNGDIGFIDFINESTVGINIEQRPIQLKRDQLEDILPAYAITIHKSQGSEYPAVIIPLCMQHYMMLNKNLLYTAMTRGKELVVLLTQQKALIMTVKKTSDLERYTYLAHCLSDWMKAETTSL